MLLIQFSDALALEQYITEANALEPGTVTDTESLNSLEKLGLGALRWRNGVMMDQIAVINIENGRRRVLIGLAYEINGFDRELQIMDPDLATSGFTLLRGNAARG